MFLPAIACAAARGRSGMPYKERLAPKAPLGRTFTNAIILGNQFRYAQRCNSIIKSASRPFAREEQRKIGERERHVECYTSMPLSIIQLKRG